MLMNFQKNIKNSRNKTSSSLFTFGTTEKKLLIIFLYYLVAAVVNFTILTLFIFKVTSYVSEKVSTQATLAVFLMVYTIIHLYQVWDIFYSPCFQL